MKENLLMAAIMPHPPIIIPEVGGKELNKVKPTVDAMQKISDDIVKLSPDTVVIVTPHSAFNPYFFTVYAEDKLKINFERFGTIDVNIEINNDIDFINNLGSTIKKDFSRLNLLPGGIPLDHGSGVPLYYLDKAGYKGNVVVINYTALTSQQHKLFGKKILETANNLNKKIVFIASGDLSHKLIPGAPAGFDEGAHEFDEKVVRCIKNGDYKSLQNTSDCLRELAGECGFNSIMVAMGIVDEKPMNNKVLSYEGPFGVGYIVAKF